MPLLPKIASCPATADLITTDELRGAYEQASRPELQETATRCLFEELFNEYLRCSSLSVYGKQQLDDSRQAVDISVGYHDKEEPLPNLVFLLLAQIKHDKVKSQGELEAQLKEYADRYLNKENGGLAVNLRVYGATAYGTKIRFFQYTRKNGRLEDTVFSGDSHVPTDEAYWDLKTDGMKIHPILKQIWEFRQALDNATTAA